MLAPYERFQMKYYSPNVTPILKNDRFYLDQCLKNDLEREQMLDFHMLQPSEACCIFMFAHGLTLHLQLRCWEDITVIQV